MKNIQKLPLITLAIYIILTVVISCWYVFSLNYIEEYNSKDIFKIIIQIGLVGAIIPTLTISLMYYFIIKVEKKLLLLFITIMLIIFLIFQIYWISINLFFYEINGSKSFIRSLIEAF